MNVRTFARRRWGAMLPLVAVCLVILFIAAALAVDIARVHVTRAELRTATDAAAQAAIDTLSRTQDPAQARQAAKNFAEANLVAGDPLTLSDTNIVFGRNIPQADGSFQFSAGETPPNAVRVIGSRAANSPDGSVSMMFGPLFGVQGFEPEQVCTASRLDRDIALVLDVSGSMGTDDRFTALVNAVNVFLTEIQASPDQEFVSLTVYESTASKLVTMTTDMNLISQQLSNQSPNGATAIGSGLNVGLDSVVNDALSRELAEKTIILMTDGNHNTGINPVSVATQAKNEGVTVHTITFSDGANQALMQDVANETGGIHLHASNNQQLIDTFREIAKQLPVLITE